ncbi:glycosyltransferase family 4 protein [Microbacterium betulae]|uniref:Glycosyltransferase family 4 protein n=1 Tax=Microbacterium betulae TaxID=2981139 RepID=A0AA97I653_9MICO|nr:glycosyltransferase family 4 protein [Microbacterium sp. AB]WOF22262.1 glycosyltransferase family 4 protein [Microbacterium sp. AB]
MADADDRRTPLPVIVTVSAVHPSYSETFVSNEILALRERGARVLSYSLRRPPRDLVRAAEHIAPPAGFLRLLPWAVLAAVARPRRLRVPRLRRRRGLRAALSRWAVDAHGLRLARALRRLGEEHVLHAHFLAHTAEVAVRAAAPTTPVVVTVHAGDADLRRSEDHRAFLGRVTAFRFASEAVRRTLRADHPEAGGEVIPCLVHLPPRRTRLQPLPDRLRVVTVARLIESKGYEEMMSAIEMASRRGQVTWTIVGEGPVRDRIERWQRDAGGRNVTTILRGALPHADALSALDDADAFLLLPRMYGERGTVRDGDGIPVALMEAMARGVPVVTTAAGGIPELVEDALTGVVLDGDDAARLADALWEAGRTPLSQAIVERAERRVRTDYSPATVASRLAGLLGGSLRRGEQSSSGCGAH